MSSRSGSGSRSARSTARSARRSSRTPPARRSRRPELDLLGVLAFAFDPQVLGADEDYVSSTEGFATSPPNATLGRLPVLLVRMNNDLVMGDDLKKTGAGNLFTVFGEPDIEITSDGDEVTVEILGVDVYDPTTGEVRSRDTDHIALWMIDTNYNEESFFVRHCYFTGGNDPYKRLKRALKADIDEDAWATLYSTDQPPVPQAQTPARSPSRSSTTTATKSCKSSRSSDVKLTRVEIKNYRSVFHDYDTKTSFEIELGDGVNSHYRTQQRRQVQRAPSACPGARPRLRVQPAARHALRVGGMVEAGGDAHVPDSFGRDAKPRADAAEAAGGVREAGEARRREDIRVDGRGASPGCDRARCAEPAVFGAGHSSPEAPAPVSSATTMSQRTTRSPSSTSACSS